MIVRSPWIIGDLNDRQQGYGFHVQLDHPYRPVFAPRNLIIGDQETNDIWLIQGYDWTPKGLIFCNVYEEIPVLRYVRLPAMEELVTLSQCYTVRIWTLKMDVMVWELDGMVDATELWALEEEFSFPVVCLATSIPLHVRAIVHHL
ncbi:hypothetical protein HU200_005408 [Digitaria exilis]|uniref:Uncharacterized protein n=1 Tax=Digitaria exilis TaxID=1010633 RepID=A0A835KSZ0_9POAL|nr:hypothetical protein HU200_005408 [Digitaria exilis]